MKAIRWIMIREESEPYFISDSNQVVIFARDVLKLHEKDRENFVVLLLNTKNMIIGYETISIGILDASLVHPREVFKPAIIGSASKIIIVHNHPSGNPCPSREDKDVTDKIESAGKILGIPMIDHVIIGSNGYFSFLEGK